MIIRFNYKVNGEVQELIGEQLEIDSNGFTKIEVNGFEKPLLVPTNHIISRETSNKSLANVLNGIFGC